MSEVCPEYPPTRGVLNPLSSPWPFAQWGLDIVGPFPRAIANLRWLLIGIDYFTKWIEAELLANIQDQDVKKFVWRNIVMRFGIPYTFVSDNGTQFDSKAFRRYCSVVNLESGTTTLPLHTHKETGRPRSPTR